MKRFSGKQKKNSSCFRPFYRLFGPFFLSAEKTNIDRIVIEERL